MNSESDKTQMALYSVIWAICHLKSPHPDPKQLNTCFSAPLVFSEQYPFVYLIPKLL